MSLTSHILDDNEVWFLADLGWRGPCQHELKVSALGFVPRGFDSRSTLETKSKAET